MHELNSGSTFFTTSRQPAAQPAGAFGARTNSGGSLDTASTHYPYSSAVLGTFADDQDDDTAYMTVNDSLALRNTSYRVDKRSSQDLSYRGSLGATARDSGMLLPGHADPDQPQAGIGSGAASLASFTGQASSSNHHHHSHHHRSSFHAQTHFPPHGANQRAHSFNGRPDNDHVRQELKNMTLDDAHDAAASAVFANIPPHSGAAQPGQANPASQVWGDPDHAALSRAAGLGYSAEAYGGDAPAASYLQGKRASIIERGPTPASQFRTVHSPKFGATPPAGPDPWSQPAPRDLRMAADGDRRPLAHPFVQQQPPTPTPYSGTYYAPNFVTLAPYSAYDQFGPPPAALRHHMMIPSYA